jgi:hypothetical protein
MDRLDALIAVAHLKLRLETIQRHPEYLMATTPTLPAPMEFAGLKSRLQRAKVLEARAGVVGPRVDAALDVIEAGVGVLETHAPELEKYGSDLMSTINGMLSTGSNGGPALDAPTAAPPSVAANPTLTPAAPETHLGPNGGPRILNSAAPAAAVTGT